MRPGTISESLRYYHVLSVCLSGSLVGTMNGAPASMTIVRSVLVKTAPSRQRGVEGRSGNLAQLISELKSFSARLILDTAKPATLIQLAGSFEQ